MTTTCVSGLSSALAMLSVAAAVHGQPATVLYVDDDAPAGGGGATWQDAFKDLQDALAVVAKVPGRAEVRIAEGTYRLAWADGDPDLSFRVSHWSPVSSVTLLITGGFAGIGRPDPDHRDVAAHPTVLSGDLRGDDKPGFQNRADNSFCVLRLIESDQSLILDGITVQGGYSRSGGDPSDGAGVTILSLRWWGDTGPVIRQCTIRDNHSADGAGGIGARVPSLRLERCTISGNQSLHDAGGMRVQGLRGNIDDCALEDCTITGNTGTSAGGLRLDDGGTTLRRCVVSGNHSTDGGGGIRADEGLRAENCLLTGNSAALLGGAIYCRGAFLLLDYCTLVGNTAASGGAVFFLKGGGGIRNSILWDNRAGSEAAVEGAGPLQDLWVVASAVEGGQGSINGPFTPLVYIGNFDADPRFRTPFSGTPDYRLVGSSPCIDAADQSVRPYTDFDLDGMPRFVGAADIGCYELQNPSCVSDFNGDGYVDGLDADGFCNAFAADDLYADLNGDGSVDTLDYDSFFRSFDAGC